MDRSSVESYPSASQWHSNHWLSFIRLFYLLLARVPIVFPALHRYTLVINPAVIDID